MSRISIVDLEVFYSVGVTDEERSKPQRLLLTVDMDLDFTAAVSSDRVERSINYYTVAQKLFKYGETHSWRLLERLASNLADFLMIDFKPERLTLEVKKFPIPQAKYVSVTVMRGHHH